MTKIILVRIAISLKYNAAKYQSFPKVRVMVCMTKLVRSRIGRRCVRGKADHKVGGEVNLVGKKLRPRRLNPIINLRRSIYFY